MTPTRGRRRRDGGRSVLIALVSSIVFFTVIAIAFTSSSSWPLVEHDFFDANTFWRYLPIIAGAFVTNIQLFLLTEVLVLIFGLVVAVLRSLSGPVFFPIRLLAIAYADIFRGLPSILIIFLLGFGVASLGLPGVPNDPFFWAAVSLTLVYTACVWLSIVYLGEHYIVDIIGGVVFALAVFFGEDAFTSWWHTRRASAQLPRT